MWTLYPLIFLSGFVDSIAGGGGIISLSAYLAAGLPPHLALGTNKFSATLGTGVAAARFAAKGRIRWDAALFSFLGALGGSALGARLALYVPERVLVYILLAVLPLIAALVLRGKRFMPRATSLTKPHTLVLASLVGFLLGGYDGFFGPGTGTFLIMAFVAVLRFDVLTACGNAKAVNFASNIAAAVTFMAHGRVDYALGIPLALCAVLGQFIGAGLALQKGVKLVRPMIVMVIVLLMAKILYDLMV
ncbi:MAG: TSUP family transporter [Firmicutes bacterium]|nr:TSUP family transporter [Bacillota bacterium]